MLRVLALLRARLSGVDRGTSLPVAPMLMHALVAAMLCGLVHEDLPPWGYGIFALTVSGALVSIPLLGELGFLLRADPAREWVSALPVRPLELRLARTLHMLVVLGFLASGSLLPAAWLAPGEAGFVGSLVLFAGGVGLVLLIAASLLAIQALLGGRAESLLVLAQMLLVTGVMVGLTAGLEHVPALARPPIDTEGVRGWPPSWFAGPYATLAARGVGIDVTAAWLMPAVAVAAALVLLSIAPLPKAPAPLARPGIVARLLAPARALATRTWVRPDERGIFDLVYDALPREREVVLRTYPMIGIPLAFLFLAMAGEPGPRRDGLSAILLFCAGTYLPILLTHVPASSSAAAAWIHTVAPVSEGAVRNGALKALAVRFLLPLYVVLALLAWQQSGVDALRLVLPGALVSLLVLRRLYASVVTSPPLSTLPDELVADFDWAGLITTLAFVLVVVAVLASVLITSWVHALALSGVLLAIELRAGSTLRRQVG